MNTETLVHVDTPMGPVYVRMDKPHKWYWEFANDNTTRYGPFSDYAAAIESLRVWTKY